MYSQQQSEIGLITSNRLVTILGETKPCLVLTDTSTQKLHKLQKTWCPQHIQPPKIFKQYFDMKY